MTATAPSSPVAPPTTDLRVVLDRLKDAQRKHGAPSFDERVRRLDRLKSALMRRKGAVVAAISRDFGNRSSHETLGAEVFGVLSAIRHAKVRMRDWMETEERDVGWVFLPADARVIPQPAGVVGIISPWNYPVLLSLSPLVGALAAGNRAMLKPSELAPETAALLRDLVAEAFAEDEVVVVPGGPEVGELFSHLPFDHLFFTGSTRVGKLVARAASENLVPVTLELGGKSPVIIGPGISIRTAAERIMAGKLFNAGQTCIAPDYVMIHPDVREAFIAGCREAVAKMYPSLDRSPDYTSIISDGHLARLRNCVRDAQSHGARIVELNPAQEKFESSRKLVPMLVLDPNDEMLVLKEEIFGPLLPVLAYRHLDEAIAYVNAHPRPLALYYFGDDREAIGRVISETMSGAVTINETLLHAMQEDLPFGGIGSSGFGQYHGREGFDAFTKKKPIFHQSRLSARALMRPPYGKTASMLLRLLTGK
ncbi:MAG: coniferyl aldehyde dehydrogenase [Myxococcota bacterium]|nr:coniferyl aldehyde dehydrogenase [Myxococcota bacterium]